MKHEKWISRLIAFAMSFGLAYAGISCIVTGFDLDVDLNIIGINVLIAAAIITMVTGCRWGNLILAGVIALFVNVLWHRSDLARSVEGLVYWISRRFHNAYQCGVVFWSEEPPLDAGLEMALSLAGLPVIWATAWTVMRRKPALLAVPAAALLPAVCFVITSSVPDPWCIFLLFIILLLLILTQTVRRRAPADANRLVAIMLIPVLLCTSLLFWAVPVGSYPPRVDTPAWMQGVLTGFGQFTDGAGSSEKVNLSTLGPKLEARTEVMQVKSTQTGVIYLRGRVYDVYEGTSWSVSDVDMSQDKYWPTENMVAAGRVTVTNRNAKTMRYVPYYPSKSDWLNQLVKGAMEGEETETYSFLTAMRVGADNLNVPVTRDAIVEQCLLLPDATSAQAKEIIKTLELIPTYSDWKKAQIIGEYVRNLHTYDTRTGTMPSDEKDFALWFLTEAETGYCVHFASAAVVLLRAAGVPARYVTGYMVNTGSGFAIVEERHAHAWVEYLDSNRGWTVLDPTPADSLTTPTEPSETTQPTDPSETTEPTMPTDPSESTEPTEPPVTEVTTVTEPTGSTDPSGEQPERPAAQRDWRWLWNALKYTALVLSVLGLIALQYYLRIALRERKRRKGNVNQKALADWREVIRLSRLLRQPIPEKLEELAEKAKFSQHTLTDSECDEFLNRLAQLHAMLQSKNWLWRNLLKLVFAIQ